MTSGGFVAVASPSLWWSSRPPPTRSRVSEMADLRVNAPLVIAKRADGSDVYLYEGATFPDGMAKGEAERLADFLESDSAAAKKAAAKSSDK